jgi:hypothetical protein
MSEMLERVAVITDVHANLPALEAALARIDTLGVEAIYCGGDLVGNGPHPNEVCALIEDRGIPTIYGNYDYAIARGLEDCGCAYRDPHERENEASWNLDLQPDRMDDEVESNFGPVAELARKAEDWGYGAPAPRQPESERGHLGRTRPGRRGDLAAAAGPGRGLALVGGVAAVAALAQAALSVDLDGDGHAVRTFST